MSTGMLNVPLLSAGASGTQSSDNRVNDGDDAACRRLLSVAALTRRSPTAV